MEVRECSTADVVETLRSEVARLQSIERAAREWFEMPVAEMPEGVAFDYAFVAEMILAGVGPKRI